MTRGSDNLHPTTSKEVSCPLGPWRRAHSGEDEGRRRREKEEAVHEGGDGVWVGISISQADCLLGDLHATCTGKGHWITTLIAASTGTQRLSIGLTELWRDSDGGGEPPPRASPIGSMFGLRPVSAGAGLLAITLVPNFISTKFSRATDCYKKCG